ncbi:molybdenum cofactor biosynthesis protein MoaE [Saccharibacillus kuerlensis]|uniref:Molybdopterin synthase catalytic subunit n=1 Tax=Saccharibacillus kuerlensis TaxID=459527 RepID=A0ABQ2L441_9BACL|nr:molybdenum cofactor biosynthesis protein MoaE [Saccharibacillus kuerlensis]GGO02033.1 molybdopterin synthase catalytic subunit [Saccharibacillus kuerlensis]
MKAYEIVTEPIEPQRYADYVLRPEAGAVTLFTGHVREWTRGIRTLYLAYEAYIPMAEKMLTKIGAKIEEKWPGTKTAIAHRIGELQIGEIAVVIAVSSPHRRDAYEANEYAIERIKESVPIWKKEIWEDGTEWIGDQRKKPDVSNENKGLDSE